MSGHALLAGRVVVVSGGSSGIGRALCVRAAEEGASAVLIADRTPLGRDGGPHTEQLVREAGATALF
ncbi:MAG: SDR family NAD(P)-dependent oxidoreductase, partial [Herbiconiux sp.]|nr:SDR family NAD(P)-dependent oxidoreductase [Herbiconiux sp.]